MGSYITGEGRKYAVDYKKVLDSIYTWTDDKIEKYKDIFVVPDNYPEEQSFLTRINLGVFESLSTWLKGVLENIGGDGAEEKWSVGKVAFEPHFPSYKHWY